VEVEALSLQPQPPTLKSVLTQSLPPERISRLGAVGMKYHFQQDPVLKTPVLKTKGECDEMPD
jgi:hypothetical protein